MSDACSNCTFSMTSTSTTIYVPYPSWNNMDSSINKSVRLFNMWTNSVETTDEGLGDDATVLRGIWRVCGTFEGLCFPICFPACFSKPLSNWWKWLKKAMNRGDEFTINELGDCIDGIYVIQDFRITNIKKAIAAYEYELVLKKVRDI